MVRNDYLKKPMGSPADIIIGQNGSDNRDQGNILQGRTHHAVDDKDRLWGVGHGRLYVYQLPFKDGAQPLRVSIPLYWADEPHQEVNYGVANGAAAFDPINRHLWVLDKWRLLRIKNPDDWNGKLLVDAVIGQPDKETTQLAPVASDNVIGHANSVRFDRRGNLYV